MAGAPFWGNASHVGQTFSDDPWDIVFLGGDPLPGICEIKGLAQLELDKKKQKGSNGLTLTVTGYQPGPFEISVTLWTADQWDIMQTWIDNHWIAPQKARPQFTSRQVRSGSNPDGTPIFKTATVKNKAPQVAIDISHPSTDTLGITSCVLQGISIPESASAEGVKVIKIKAIESRATGKTVTKTAKGSSNNVALAKELRPKALADVPNKPSTERADLGPKGPRPKPGSGSN